MTNYIKSIKELEVFIANGDFSQIIVIADTNTAQHGLPHLDDSQIKYDELITFPAGEKNKTFETCLQVWSRMTDKKIDRHAVVLNLGGGVVTDLGGFCAATYKRGIDFIHVPTSLLGMVDAAIGGKTGIDFDGYKNQIGAFAQPRAIYLQPDFLKTLPQEEWVSGYAEIYKHALIQDHGLWKKLNQKSTIDPSDQWADIIWSAVEIKEHIVERDPFEKSDRKALNFGHTIGHAIESNRLHMDKPISHGMAVAMGMICESYLSQCLGFISEADLSNITNHLTQIYELEPINLSEYDSIYDYCLGDKKNKNGQILCTMIGPIGDFRINQAITQAEIWRSLDFYNGL